MYDFHFPIKKIHYVHVSCEKRKDQGNFLPHQYFLIWFLNCWQMENGSLNFFEIFSIFSFYYILNIFRVFHFNRSEKFRVDGHPKGGFDPLGQAVSEIIAKNKKMYWFYQYSHINSRSVYQKSYRFIGTKMSNSMLLFCIDWTDFYFLNRQFKIVKK